ncbi:MAG: cofactor assembly of complex C subunit B, partial [Prochlorotrichaceae cyanobacterium]
MSTSLTIPSSLFLTLLIIIGLFFFIRASVKDRTEARNIALPLSPPDALEY